jgi:hypothetical protein
MMEDWGFWRWYQESRKYMGHKPWWWVLPRAITKWPAFNRQQHQDRRDYQRRVG